MSTDFFASSYATGTDSWSNIPLLPDLMTVMKVVPAGSMVMDIGCGRGKITLALAQAGYRMIGIDLLAAVINRANAQAADRQLGSFAKFMAADATATGFTDASFDAAIEIGLLHHMDYQTRTAVLAESYRTIKPGGHFISVALSRETKQFLDYQPFLSQDGNFARFGLDYHFFTAAEMKAELETRFTLLTQFVAEYKTTAYGADTLSFLFSVCQKPMNGDHNNSQTTPQITSSSAHDSIFA